MEEAAYSYTYKYLNTKTFIQNPAEVKIRMYYQQNGLLQKVKVLLLLVVSLQLRVSGTLIYTAFHISNANTNIVVYILHINIIVYITTYVCVCIYVYICICMYIYAQTHTHTHTYIYTHKLV